MSSNHQIKLNKEKLNTIVEDVLRPVGLTKSFHAWMGFLTVLLIICLYFYFTQLQKGLIVTGMRDMVSWGMYIANFVFFVATALVGMLLSAVLGLIGFKWIKPVTRIAEIIAVAFAAVAGLVIVSDMGRPDRLPNVFIYGRFQSPILWDVTVVTTYVLISALLYLLPLIPDMAIAKGRINNSPKWLHKIYDILSFKWTHKPEQYKILFRAIRILLILIVPTAFAIHTVTSWLFAVTLRTGWDSTIFGPYFLSGAFVTGMGAVIIAVYFFRVNYKLEKYLTNDIFDKLGKLLFLVAVIYFYFNLNEFLIPAYKLKQADGHHIHALFEGRYALLFWYTQLTGLIIPMLLMLMKPMRKPLPMLLIAIFVVIGSWLKRFLIVIPTMEGPFLPIQNLPHEWAFYSPTLTEIMITIAPIVMALMIISILTKLFPVFSIW